MITGAGMALLYPNLSAAVADLSSSSIRSSAIGIYRFWRDIGYMVAAIVFGINTLIFEDIVSSFILVFILMIVSNLIVVIYVERDRPNIRIA